MSVCASPRRNLDAAEPELELDTNIAARARALREGRPMPKLADQFIVPPGAPASTRNFRSAPNAKPMAADDVANVEPLMKDECAQLLQMLAESSPGLYRDLVEASEEMWGGWPADDERWTLTPHELRKSRRSQRRRLANV